MHHAQEAKESLYLEKAFKHHNYSTYHSIQLVFSIKK